MEPSCLAVFKDELTGMLPHDDDAHRLAQNAHHFSEFFEKFDVAVPRLERKALVWGHCHHKATGGMDGEHSLLKRMGLDVEPVNGGCCGLAGSWGFEQGHHEVSMQCGELGLLPAVRDAADDTLVIADGFSCKTQVEQAGLGRRALHVGQVMSMARHHGASGYLAGRPEDGVGVERPQPSDGTRAARIGVPAVGTIAAAAAAAGLIARRFR
jgi:Fe-S oxidoreductase